MAANAPSNNAQTILDAEEAAPTPEASGSEASTQTSFQQNVVNFLSARAELASIEATEAAEHVAKKLISGIALAFCAFFTWSLLLASLTGLLAPFIDQALGEKANQLPGWAIILLIWAILHGIAGYLFFSKLKKKPATPLFELSLKELELDKQWLKKNK